MEEHHSPIREKVGYFADTAFNLRGMVVAVFEEIALRPRLCDQLYPLPDPWLRSIIPIPSKSVAADGNVNIQGLSDEDSDLTGFMRHALLAISVFH